MWVLIVPLWLVLWISGRWAWPVRVITFIMFSGTFIAGQHHRIADGSPVWLQAGDMFACVALAWIVAGIPSYVRRLKARAAERATTVHQERGPQRVLRWNGSTTAV